MESRNDFEFRDAPKRPNSRGKFFLGARSIVRRSNVFPLITRTEIHVAAGGWFA